MKANLVIKFCFGQFFEKHLKCVNSIYVANIHFYWANHFLHESETNFEGKFNLSLNFWNKFGFEIWFICKAIRNLKSVGQDTNMINGSLTSLSTDLHPIICMSKILKIAYLTEKLEIISIRMKNLGPEVQIISSFWNSKKCVKLKKFFSLL